MKLAYSLYLSICDLLPKIRGLAIRVLLTSPRLQIGQNFRCDRGVLLTARKSAAISIGANVEIRRDVEVRATGNARVAIGNDVRIDRGVRIIATNDSKVVIGSGTRIGLHSVMNAGDCLTIGEKCLISGYVYLQTSMHSHRLGTSVREQGFLHAPIVLEDDVWLGAHATVLPGCRLSSGAVVGSTAVVTRDVAANDIVAGIPARRLKSRENCEPT